MKITREIKKIELNFIKTFPYFLYHIESEKILSNKVIERVNFHQGTFFTILPLNAELKNLYYFDGGIIPGVPYGNKVYDIEGFPEGYQPLKVETMDLECSNFIFSYLNENNCNCSLIENYMLKPDSPDVNINNVLATFYNEDVNFFLNKSNSVNEIYTTIKECKELWYFLSVLSKIETQFPKYLKDEDLNKICDKAKFIICSAYDGDSYLFWERS